MADRRAWTAFFGTTLTVIVLLGFLSLNGARDKEKKLRAQKDLELQNTLLEVSEKEAAIASLRKQKGELEEQFNAKIERLERSLAGHDSEMRAHEDKIAALEEENQGLRRDVDTKNRKVAELLRRIEGLETDKADLLAMVKKLESERAALPQDGASSTGAGALDGAFSTASPAASRAAVQDLDPVELGKIVVQRSSGRAAEVQYVNSVYGYVILNAGFKDGLRENTVVNLVRDKRLVAKVVVQRVRSDVAAAAILPEWTQGEIRVGDVVSRF